MIYKIDLRLVYYQLRNRAKDIPKIAFRTCYDHYEFLMMPLGLSNALAKFMDLMTPVFMPYIESFIIMFIDDIFIHLKSREDDEQHLKIMLQILRD